MKADRTSRLSHALAAVQGSRAVPLADGATCGIALTLDRIGDRWSILILREAYRGLSRFGELQARLGVAPNILSRRLRRLCEVGLLERRRYCERPRREEYVLTPRGRSFRSVLRALCNWGNKHYGNDHAGSGAIDRTGPGAVN